MKTYEPDIKAAVQELLYIIKSEEAKPSTQRNSETLIACRNTLYYLIGTRQAPKAKAWLYR